MTAAEVLPLTPAENGERFLADEEVRRARHARAWAASSSGPSSPSALEPAFWQVFRFAAPALNVGMLKRGLERPACALATEVFRIAGFPAGCFETLLCARVVEDGRVAAATLTGSEWAGAAVASAAGKA